MKKLVEVRKSWYMLEKVGTSLKKLAQVESDLLYILSNAFVISMETDISYKMSDSTRANFFKRSLESEFR